MNNSHDDPIAVIGGGPAGLTAAYWLTGRGRKAVVFEADTQVGGISRTVEYKGFRFDIGGHRFFTKVKAVNELWHLMLGPEMLKRPRLSRIFYNGKFFDYPLRAMNALFGLGVWNAVRVMTSYVSIRLRPIRPEVSVEDWVSNRFGRRLYETFFKTYTEKVWGVPCNELGAQWAAQRIRGLSLRVAVMDALFGRFKGDKSKVKTLIDQFEYPRLGPGMMWEAFQQELARRGFPVQLESKVRRITHDGGRVTGVEVEQHGVTRHLEVSALVSTMPLRELIRALSPPPRPTCSTLQTASAIGTSSRWRSSSISRKCSPTTGSTSTTPQSNSVASRISRTGAPIWCPTSVRPASASSISASRATACGR